MEKGSDFLEIRSANDRDEAVEQILVALGAEAEKSRLHLYFVPFQRSAKRWHNAGKMHPYASDHCLLPRGIS